MSGSPIRPRLSAEERRARLIEAGTEHFGERGYAGASLRGIAAAAGVTTPVVYDHFASKAELYAAVAQEHADALLAHWTQPIDGEPEEVFDITVDRLFAWVEENPHGWRLLFADVPSDPLVASVVAAIQARASSALAGVLLALPALRHPDGLSHERAAEAVAETTKSAVNGLAAWWWHNHDVSRSTVVALARDVLWRGIDRVTRTRQ